MQEDNLRHKPRDNQQTVRLTENFIISPGTIVNYTYRIVRLLKSGGMGDVYLAEHVELSTRHAIKVIQPSLICDRQILDLFRSEATSLRDVSHEAVVRYEGFFRDETGRNYLVMEYVDGPSLADKLKDGPLSVEEVYLLRDRLAIGLGAAHAKGVVHRDVSPDNVILPGGEIRNAKIIDFGICKRANPQNGTIIGKGFAGKYPFVSPEQLGLFGGEVDNRSDLYSLGLVLAAAATGIPLEMGNSYDSAREARHKVPDLSGVPAPLRQQLAGMLRPMPKDRPKNMEELLRRWPNPKLTRLNDGDKALPHVPSSLPDSRRSREHEETEPHFSWHVWMSRWYLWAGSAVLLLLLAVVAYRWIAPTPQKICQKPIEDIAGLPWARVDQCFDEFALLGAQDKAFNLLQQALRQGHKLPLEKTYQFADKLLVGGKTDEAFFLFRELGKAGHGPSAMAIGKMYDPLLWRRDRSPFGKPNARKATDWYKQAVAQGAKEAQVYLDRLDTWRTQNETSGTSQ